MPYADKSAQAAYQLGWVKGTKRAVFHAMGGRCEKCGSTERLELHHGDKDEKESHRIWSWSMDRIMAEVAKCELLCKSCHMQLHRGKLDAAKVQHIRERTEPVRAMAERYGVNRRTIYKVLRGETWANIEQANK